MMKKQDIFRRIGEQDSFVLLLCIYLCESGGFYGNTEELMKKTMRYTSDPFFLPFFREDLERTKPLLGSEGVILKSGIKADGVEIWDITMSLQALEN